MSPKVRVGVRVRVRVGVRVGVRVRVRGSGTLTSSPKERKRCWSRAGTGGA